ncbi:Fe-Mn family superoxide dismutase [Prosthecobacter fusiformis]|uniref:superoxide dismutase n=1 Tax=Prosthecobacter fusiformis TaxID=48464 RepID=A0A4R7RU75_9BACT|nr:superoxide dismutase [Prosthecobacter fusiformis]TDU69284.1 Fe-Mn family superoxide dismutase [Prosthecobacter fusiformis]
MQYLRISRRGFLSSAAAALVGPLWADSEVSDAPLGVPMRQEPLNFPFEALEPFMKASMLRQHFEEHHARYVSDLRNTLDAEGMTVGNVVSLMPGMDQVVQPQRSDSRMPLGQLVSQGRSFQPPQTLSQSSVQMIRSAGGGHINHTAFWRFLCPAGAGPTGPQSAVARAIQEDFGSVKSFRHVFKEAAMQHTEPGWAWLVHRQDGCLVVTTTSNEDNPMMKSHIPWHESGRPILALDLWEHSYYEQYQDDREQYIDAWWKVVNWDFVSRAYTIVRGKA